MKENELKIGDKVYKININMPNSKSKSSSNFDKEGIFIEELTIVYQTKCKIALSDEQITIIEKDWMNDKLSCYSYINTTHVSVRTNETYFSNGIFATCYASDNSEKQIKKVKKEIINEVNKRYGFLFNGIEDKLDCLKIQNI